MSERFPEDEEDRCADDLDKASRLADLHNTNNVLVARMKAAPQQVQNPDGTWPVTECACGEEIVPQRLAHGYVRCVGCQEAKEKREKRGMG